MKLYSRYLRNDFWFNEFFFFGVHIEYPTSWIKGIQLWPETYLDAFFFWIDGRFSSKCRRVEPFLFMKRVFFFSRRTSSLRRTFFTDTTDHKLSVVHGGTNDCFFFCEAYRFVFFFMDERTCFVRCFSPLSLPVLCDDFFPYYRRYFWFALFMLRVILMF